MSSVCHGNVYRVTHNKPVMRKMPGLYLTVGGLYLCISDTLTHACQTEAFGWGGAGYTGYLNDTHIPRGINNEWDLRHYYE